MKRGLSLLLCFVMCLGMLPVHALELETDPAEGPAAFDPGQLESLQVWYDGASAQTEGDGESVTRLVNKADTGASLDAVQTESSAQPTLVTTGDGGALSAIHLESGDYMQIGGDTGFYLEDMTFVAVMKVNSLDATKGRKSNQICSRKLNNSGEHNWYFHVTSEHKADSINLGWKDAQTWYGLGTNGQTIQKDGFYTVIASKSGTDGTVIVNGAEATFTGGGTPVDNGAPVYLGAPEGNTDLEVTLNMDLYEFMIFDQGLADQELTNLQGWLEDKYGSYENTPAPEPDPGEFDPSDVDGLTAWYDAADGASLTLDENNKVSAWADKAGGDNNALQSEAGYQPTYEASSAINEKPGVRLDKETFLQVENSFDLDDMSIFAVMTADTLEGNGDENQIFSKLGNVDPWDHNWYFNISNNGFNFGWKDDGGFHDYQGTNRTMSANVDYILSGVKADTEGRLYINGNQIGVMYGAGATKHNDQNIYIGGSGGSFKSVKGVVSEILVYNRGLTEEETDQVNAYLSEKWGIELTESTEPADGSIFLDGQEIRAFSTSCTNYEHVLEKGTTEAPQVTADFGEANVVIQQAEGVPGTATVTVTNDAVTSTYTIEFSAMDKELVNLKTPTVEQVDITDGFWKEKLDQFYTTTVEYVFDQFERTGTLKNFENVGVEGARPQGSTDPWNDGLLFETIRGASDFMRANKDNPAFDEQFNALKTRIDGYIDTVYEASKQSDNGYLSTWAMMEQPGRYFDATGNARWYHDAYNFGCMTEAAVHYYKATGEIDLLVVATRYAEFLVDNYGYGQKADGTDKINMIPSHEGPEEMLLKLYELYRDNPELKTQVEDQARQDFNAAWTIEEDEYADLVKFWIENHGNYEGRINGANYGEYAQDHDRYFNQDVAKGHAVRANLFYTGMAAAGREFEDYTYLATADNLWQNIVEAQMYITGGVGATGADEAYGPNYDLPNDGYCETCAQVAMGFFSQHLAQAFGQAEYADIVEKYIYDGVLGCIGADGDSFYYQQPLTDKNRPRWDWIEHTPCCPPMFLKFYGEMPAYIYAYDGSEVYINQFISSTMDVDGMTVAQESGMPWGGTSTFTTSGVSRLHIRIPDWAKETGTTVIKVDGAQAEYTVDANGYAVIPVQDGQKVEVTFPMEARRVYSDERVTANEGKVALAYGPLVYCVESTDMPYIPNFSSGDGNIGLPKDAELTTRFEEDLLGGVQTITFQGEYYDNFGEKQTAELKAIPFFARSNRGDSATFVWIDEEVKESGGEMKRWLASADATGNDVGGVGHSALAAFDGDASTYWAAGSAQVPQALMVDLGEETTVAQVETTFTSAQAWKYQVLTSLDGISWESFADNSTNSTQQQSFVDTGSRQARYVAVKFVESAGVGYISVQDVAVRTAENGENLVLGKLCGASSTSDFGQTVFAMIDGSDDTRYGPPNHDKPRSVTIDLGQQADITGMQILFEKASDWTFRIELSDDGKDWHEYYSDTYDMTQDGQELIIEKEDSGRYVRHTITETTGGVWASTRELEVMTKEPLVDLFDLLLGEEDTKPDTATLTVTAGAGGTVTPNGRVEVKKGGSQVFQVTPESGYRVAQFLAGGAEIQPADDGSYTVSNIQSDMEIVVTFEQTGGSSSRRYDITLDIGSHGTVKASSKTASRGTTVTLTVTPDAGYELDKLAAEDENGGEITLRSQRENVYTFRMPGEDVTVRASFVKAQEEVSGLPFQDVDEGDWYFSAVEYVYENGLMAGVSQEDFAPGSTLTRGMVAQLLYAMEEGPQGSDSGTFTDVSGDAWYADAVNWAAGQGIVSGVGDGRFAPNDPVTREQLAVILYGYAVYKGCDTTQSGVSIQEFADYDSISGWALDGMSWAVNAGLLSGKGSGMLDPGGTATRGEIAQILMNFCLSVAQ